MSYKASQMLLSLTYENYRILCVHCEIVASLGSVLYLSYEQSVTLLGHSEVLPCVQLQPHIQWNIGVVVRATYIMYLPFPLEETVLQ